MVNIYKLKLTILQQEILRFLFINTGKSFNARNLAIALEVSQPAISKALPELEKVGYIKVQRDKLSKRLSIELNRGNPDSIGLKRADNLKQLYDSGFVKFLYDYYEGAAIILFGSYAFGEDTVTSDVDIVIIGIKKEKPDLTKYEKMLERTITINYYDSLKDIDKHLLSNILNGITLKGAVEL